MGYKHWLAVMVVVIMAAAGLAVAEQARGDSCDGISSDSDCDGRVFCTGPCDVWWGPPKNCACEATLCNYYDNVIEDGTGKCIGDVEDCANWDARFRGGTYHDYCDNCLICGGSGTANCTFTCDDSPCRNICNPTPPPSGTPGPTSPPPPPTNSPTPIPSGAPPSCGQLSFDRACFLDGTEEFFMYVDNVVNMQGISFPTWDNYDEGGGTQGDIQWYPGTSIGNGYYRGIGNVTNHPHWTTGNGLITHVWGDIDGDGLMDHFCDSGWLPACMARCAVEVSSGSIREGESVDVTWYGQNAAVGDGSIRLTLQTRNGSRLSSVPSGFSEIGPYRGRYYYQRTDLVTNYGDMDDHINGKADRCE